MIGRKNMSGMAIIAVGAVLLIAAATVAAQEPSAAVRAAPAAAQAWTLRRIMHDGGWLMWLLAAVSVVGVALTVYLWMTLRVAQVVPRFLHRELVEKIRAGSMDDVRRACEYRPCPLSLVVLAGIDYLRAAHNPKGDVLKDAMESEGVRQAEGLMGQTQYLLDIAVIAPMIGLLGTIFGMIQAFSGVAFDIASAKPVVLAAGVSKALLTTAFGLVIGIPAMALYAYFRRKAAMLVSLLEVATTDVLTALVDSKVK